MREPVNYPSSTQTCCGGQIVGIRINGDVITIKNPDGTTEECTMEIGGNIDLQQYAEVKTCSKCKRVLKKTEFYKNRSMKDGLGCRCKKCENARSAEYHLNHKEDERVYRANRKKSNPKKWNASEAKRTRRKREELADCVVRHAIATNLWQRGIHLPSSAIPEDLIQAKREQLKLARAIRALKQETKNAK